MILLSPCRCGLQNHQEPKQRDELPPSQLIELHSVPSQGRMQDIALARISQEGVGAVRNSSKARYRKSWHRPSQRRFSRAEQANKLHIFMVGCKYAAFA